VGIKEFKLRSTETHKL